MPSELAAYIEDTSIEITIHARCDQDIEREKDEAKKWIPEYLEKAIKDTNNRALYTTLIQEIVAFSLSIITTNWEHIEIYEKHIEVVNLFKQKYSVELQDEKCWKRYDFILHHLNPVKEYLEISLERAKEGGC